MTTLVAHAHHAAPLQGRQPQLAALHDHLSAALSGQAQVVLITGESGVGRSHLIADFCSDLPDLPTVSLTCHPADALVGNHLLAQLDHALAGRGRPAATEGTWDQELLFGDQMGRPSLAQAGLVEDTIDALAAAAPLVLVLERAQWADPDSIAAIGQALNALAGQPLLVLLTCTSDGLPEMLGPDPAVGCHTLAVPAMEYQDMQALVDGIAPGLHPGTRDAVVAASRGLPLLALAGVDCHRGDLAVLPDNEPDLLTSRARALSDPAWRALGALALAGAPIDLKLISAACELTPQQAAAAVAEGILSGVLRTDPQCGGYTVAHPQVAAALAAEMAPEERAQMHRRLGELHTQAGDDARALAHFLTLADTAAIRASAHRAGLAAAAAHAPRTQLQLLQVAIAARPEPGAAGAPSFELLAQSAAAALAAGKLVRAREYIDAALRGIGRGAEQDGRKAELCVALLVARAGLAEQFGGDGVADSTRAVALAAPGSPPLGIALAHSASSLLSAGRWDDAAQAATSALALAARISDQRAAGRIQGLAGTVLVDLAASRGSASQSGRAALMAVRDAAAATGDLVGLMQYYQRATDCLIRSGNYPRAVELAEQARTEAATRGYAHTIGTWLTGNAAQAMVLEGSWEPALALVSWALAHQPPAGVAAELHLHRATVAFRRGQGDLCQSDLQQARALMQQAGPAQHQLTAAGLAASLAATSGDHQHALQVLDNALPDPAAGARPAAPSAALWTLAWVWTRVLAGALARKRVDPKVGWGHAKRIESLVRQLSSASCHPAFPVLLTADLTRVYDLLRPARTDRQMACWRAAVAALGAGPGLRYELAYAQLRLAEQMLSHGERRTARTALSCGSALIAELDADALAGTAQRIAESGRLNLRPVNGRTDVLTPREREVLALVARGWSNAEISRELLIAQKTTSVHVSNILGKLGVTSRIDAASWARENPDQWCPTSG